MQRRQTLRPALTQRRQTLWRALTLLLLQAL
jgi:hypothetical protein